MVLLLAAVLAMMVGITTPATAQVGGSAPPQTTVYVPHRSLCRRTSVQSTLARRHFSLFWSPIYRSVGDLHSFRR